MDNAERKYNELFEQLSLSDPHRIKEKYEKYVKEFRWTLWNYISYRSEIDSYFTIEGGMTYEDVMNEFAAWNRQHVAATSWRSYLNPNQLYQIGYKEFSEVLKSKLQGAAQLERIVQVFCVMILKHVPREVTSDWIATAQGALYGGMTDRANREKAAREITCTLIRQTFVHGICWLIQVFTFLLDKFKENITKHLLGMSGKYSYLKNHRKFLALLDLAYHRQVRTIIRPAVRVIRDLRHMRSAYAHYDITFRLITMVHSIPNHINDQSSNQIRSNNKFDGQNNENNNKNFETSSKDIPLSGIFSLAFGSGVFPDNPADRLTGNHYSDVKKSVEELYKGSVMLLVQDIRASFNANIILKLQVFITNEDNDPYDSLLSCIKAMKPNYILKMTDSNTSQIHKKMQKYATKMDDFTDCLAHIRLLNQQMESSSRMDNGRNERHHEISSSIKRDREIREKQRRKKENERLSLSSAAHSMHDTLEESYDDEDQKNILTSSDNYNAIQYLLELFRKHDEEDLTESLLPGEQLRADSSISFTEDHRASSPIYSYEGSLDSSGNTFRCL
jgi:hypothetical protein